MESAPAEVPAVQQNAVDSSLAAIKRSKMIVRSARIGSKFDSVAENLRAESIFDPKSQTIRIRFISKADQKTDSPITARNVVDIPYSAIQEVNSDPKSLDLIITVGDGSRVQQYTENPVQPDLAPTPATFIDAFKEPTVITIAYARRAQLASQRGALAGVAGIQARGPRERTGRTTRKERLEVVGHAVPAAAAAPAGKKGRKAGGRAATAASSAPSAASFAVTAGVTEYVVYDVETTIPSTDIIEFGAVVLDAATLNEKHAYSTLLHSANITPKSIAANGITADDVKSAPSFADVAPLVFALLNGRYWVGHNINRFDNVRIKEQFAKINQPAPVPAGVVDTLTLLQQQFGGRTANFKLSTFTQVFGLGPEKHRSLEDVRHTIEVLKRAATVLFLEQYAGVPKPDGPVRGTGRGRKAPAEAAAAASDAQATPSDAKPQRQQRRATQPGDRRPRNSETQEPAEEQQPAEPKPARAPRQKQPTPPASEATVAAIEAARVAGAKIWIRYTGGGRDGPGYPRPLVPKEWADSDNKNVFRAECTLGRPQIKTFRADRVQEIRDYDWNTELYAVDVELNDLGTIRDEPSVVSEAFALANASFSADELRKLFTYRVPKINAEGTCSLPDQLEAEPFDMAKALHGKAPEDLATDPEAQRLFRLNKVVELLQQRTKADWLGVYRRATAALSSTG
eukprot:TRINITY_DN9862_c0_g1_i3.p2 TRINITY_DN9862_c0_g1~~TRINITY_DN9862_c0_g1_i3.p2  ORF type:complete len:684 (-),score=268.43 TRINITY_DN9862_c0_g1_i3:751-2802(-)